MRIESEWLARLRPRRGLADDCGGQKLIAVHVNGSPRRRYLWTRSTLQVDTSISVVVAMDKELRFEERVENERATMDTSMPKWVELMASGTGAMRSLS